MSPKYIKEVVLVQLDIMRDIVYELSHEERIDGVSAHILDNWLSQLKQDLYKMDTEN